MHSEGLKWCVQGCCLFNSEGGGESNYGGGPQFHLSSPITLCLTVQYLYHYTQYSIITQQYIYTRSVWLEWRQWGICKATCTTALYIVPPPGPPRKGVWHSWAEMEVCNPCWDGSMRRTSAHHHCSTTNEKVRHCFREDYPSTFT